ncbi:MAG: hypothetical protein PHW64_07455 [Sulfuricurvum sp.]|nr:hypothetical protein [Sulfuricurvum sp.]
MKFFPLLPLTSLCLSLYAEELPTSAILPPQPNLVQEIVIGNREPIDVKITNFPPKSTQTVKLESNDPINVIVSNPIKTVAKEQSKIVLLRESANLLSTENSTFLGELNTDLQNIFIYKVNVKNSNGEATGLKIQCIADKKLEVSKDIKILVENELYMDDDEFKKLNAALSKMITVAGTPVEEKDYKLSYRTTGDFELNVYTTKKMFGGSRGVEASLIIGNNEKYSSKAIMSLEELIALKALFDKYSSAKLTSL